MNHPNPCNRLSTYLQVSGWSSYSVHPSGGDMLNSSATLYPWPPEKSAKTLRWSFIYLKLSPSSLSYSLSLHLVKLEIQTLDLIFVQFKVIMKLIILSTILHAWSLLCLPLYFKILEMLFKWAIMYVSMWVHCYMSCCIFWRCMDVSEYVIFRLLVFI